MKEARFFVPRLIKYYLIVDYFSTGKMTSVW